jgi:raffinose/stachyose/melibiose transport system substrate-binding protein
MKKSLRKVSTIFVAIVVILSMVAMVGCGSNGNGSASSSVAASSGAASDSSKAEATKPAEKVSIRLGTCWADSDPQFPAKKAIIDKFMQQNPNITVEDEYTGSTQYHDKLKTEIASDTLPDAFVNWGGSEVREAVKAKKFLDLTDVINQDADFKNAFLPSALQDANVTYTDIPGLWGMPWENLSTGFYYNKDLFAKAGVNPPQTWDDLVNVIGKLKGIGVIPWALGGKDGWRPEHLYEAIIFKQNGCGIASDLPNRKVKYSDAASVNAFKKLEELRDMGAFGPNPASVDFPMEQNLFQNGKAAMNFSLNVFIGTYTGKDSSVAGKVGFFPFPYFADKAQFKDSMFGGGAACYSVSSSSQGAQKDAAIKLLKAICSVDGQKEFVKVNALLPTVKIDNLDSVTTDPLAKSFAQTIASAKEYSLGVTVLDTVSSLLDKQRSVCTGLLNKQLTAEQAGKEMDNEIAKNSK